MNEIIETDKDSSGHSIEVFNLPSDPIMWVVRKYKKILFFKKMISSKWFNDKDQAFDYFEKLRNTDGNLRALPEYGKTQEFRHYKTKIL